MYVNAFLALQGNLSEIFYEIWYEAWVDTGKQASNSNSWFIPTWDNFYQYS